MVDALRRIRGWLRPSGYLIDLRPAATRACVEVGRDERDAVLIGDLVSDEERLHRHAAADIALAGVLNAQLFVTEAVRTFTFRRYGDSAGELRDYVNARWQHVTFPDPLRVRADEARAARLGARVWISEWVGIRSLRPLTRPPSPSDV
jgi:hypothetical protein